VSRGISLCLVQRAPPPQAAGTPARWTGHPSGGRGPAALRAAAGPPSGGGQAPFGRRPGHPSGGGRASFGRGPGQPSGGGGASLRVGGRASFGRGAGHPSGGGGASLRGGGQAPSRGGRAGIRGGREWWALGGVDVGEAFGGRIGRSGSGFPYRRHRTGATGGFGVRVRAC